MEIKRRRIRWLGRAKISAGQDNKSGTEMDTDTEEEARKHGWMMQDSHEMKHRRQLKINSVLVSVT